MLRMTFQVPESLGGEVRYSGYAYKCSEGLGSSDVEMNFMEVGLM